MTKEQIAIIGVGRLFKQSWLVYKNNFLVLVGIIIIPALVMMLSLLFNSFLGFVIYLLGIIGLVWGQLSLIVFIVNGKKISVKEAYQQSWQKLLPAVWVMVISSFIILGGFYLFLIPGIIFTFWFIFALMIVVSENDIKGLSVLVKSREYVRGYFWPIVLRYILLVIIVGGISFLVSLILNKTAVGDSENLVNLILPVLLSAILIPFTVSYLVQMYESLKTIKGETLVVKKSSKTSYLLVATLGWLFLIVMVIFFGSFILNLLDRSSFYLSEFKSTEQVLINDLNLPPAGVGPLE